MKFTFLGTSAGEQYPGFWCRCATCEQARKLGGRNIRVNSCAHLGPDCMIDLNDWAFGQAYRFNVPIIDTQHLLVTHADGDHLSKNMIWWRWMNPNQQLPISEEGKKLVVGPRFSEVPLMHIYGSERVYNVLEKNGGRMMDAERDRMTLHLVRPFVEFQAGDMRVMPVQANHGEHSLNYIIQREGKTILYALDTGWFFPQTLECISQYQYDMVVIEGTFGLGKHMAEDDGHMNLTLVERAYNLFGERGLLRDGAPFCVSHICPHFTPVHDEIAPIMAEKGITMAYDGMVVDL